MDEEMTDKETGAPKVDPPKADIQAKILEVVRRIASALDKAGFQIEKDGEPPSAGVE